MAPSPMRHPRRRRWPVSTEVVALNRLNGQPAPLSVSSKCPPAQEGHSIRCTAASLIIPTDNRSCQLSCSIRRLALRWFVSNTSTQYHWKAPSIEWRWIESICSNLLDEMLQSSEKKWRKCSAGFPQQSSFFRKTQTAVIGCQFDEITPIKPSFGILAASQRISKNLEES